MPLLLIGTLVILLTVGGGDRLSAWLMPGFPPQLGAMILIAALILVTALSLTPTRLLANAIIVGIGTVILAALKGLLQACLSALRILWDRSRSAWRTLRGSA